MVDLAPGFYKGMKGGKKHQLMDYRRPEILAYYDKHGLEATLQRYGTKKDTFERFLLSKPKTKEKMTRIDRIEEMAKMALDGNRECRRDTREMKDEFRQLVPLVAQEFAGYMVKALQSIEVPRDRDPRLNITDFKGELGK